MGIMLFLMDKEIRFLKENSGKRLWKLDFHINRREVGILRFVLLCYSANSKMKSNENGRVKLWVLAGYGREIRRELWQKWQVVVGRSTEEEFRGSKNRRDCRLFGLKRGWRGWLRGSNQRSDKKALKTPEEFLHVLYRATDMMNWSWRQKDFGREAGYSLVMDGLLVGNEEKKGSGLRLGSLDKRSDGKGASVLGDRRAVRSASWIESSLHQRRDEGIYRWLRWAWNIEFAGKKIKD